MPTLPFRQVAIAGLAVALLSGDRLVAEVPDSRPPAAEQEKARHVGPPADGPKTIGPQPRADSEKVQQLFSEAQRFYDTAGFDLAKERCEQILAIDKDNLAARNMAERIDRKRLDRIDLTLRGSSATQWPDAAHDLNRKLDRILIPKLELRDATIREAVEFLKKKSFEWDAVSIPSERGVNIVLKLEGVPGGATPVAPLKGAPSIPGLDPPRVAAVPVPVSEQDVRITLSLDNVSLREALKSVTGLANLKFRVEPNTVLVVSMSEYTNVLLTQEWKIPPYLIPQTFEPAGAANGGLTAPAPGASVATGAPPADAKPGGSTIAVRQSAKNWLTANGVVFNGPSAAIYLVRSGRLIVRNTQDQLDLVETIIAKETERAAPAIEARKHLEELAFDWLSGQSDILGNQRDFIGGGIPGNAPP